MWLWALACISNHPTCPEGTVLIEGGPYLIGVSQARQSWQQAAHEVRLDPYCMDVYEYPNQKGVDPKMIIDWYDAQALCQAQGKRLCTSDEWERACRGPNRLRYSYGARRDPSICNTPINGPGPGKAPAPLAVSGAHPGCVSAEGVYDLNGNLSEWVSDPWTGPPESFNKTARVDPETWRTLRGGTMWSHTFYGQDCTSRHGHLAKGSRFNDDGFRCCLTPP